jgi:2-desacetyl-2-hydroxyethyl bacteriochlorophyllide A dehydrogenase
MLMSHDAGTTANIDARALWLSAPRTVEFRQEMVSPPGPDEIRVKTIASALSQGTEMLVYRGQVPSNLALDLPSLAGSFAFPIKYGYAAVGRVIDIGPGVTSFRPGDHVFVHHPHQSAFVVPAHPSQGPAPVLLPSDLDPLLGLFIANLETAVNVLLDTPIRLGETALVFGQGTVGLLIAQLLRRAGAGQVIVVDPLERRRALALQLGADEAFAPEPELRQRISEMTVGRGADVAIESSGSGAALQAAIDNIALEGTVVVVSWYGSKPVSLVLGEHFHRGRLHLRSSQVGRINPELSARWDHSRRLALALDLLPGLQLAQLISHRIPFAQAATAYDLVDQRSEEVVQVILTYDDGTDHEKGDEDV